MAQVNDLVVKISADTTQFERQIADQFWSLFLLWERGAANNGSGLTKEQMIGARVYHDWYHRTREQSGSS